MPSKPGNRWGALKKLRPAQSSTPPAPASAPVIQCRYCRNVLERNVNPVDPQGRPAYTTPIGERVPAGVALPNECPERPLGGTTFGRHEPM